MKEVLIQVRVFFLGTKSLLMAWLQRHVLVTALQSPRHSPGPGPRDTGAATHGAVAPPIFPLTDPGTRYLILELERGHGDIRVPVILHLVSVCPASETGSGNDDTEICSGDRLR